MVNVLKTYKNKEGYTIQATEKAYNLFYKKLGFTEDKKIAAKSSKGEAKE